MLHYPIEALHLRQARCTVQLNREMRHEFKNWINGMNEKLD